MLPSIRLLEEAANGFIESRALFVAESRPCETHLIEARDASGSSNREREREDVLEGVAPAAEHRVLSDAHELVATCLSSELRVVAHHDVPRQPNVVDEHDVPPDGAVVRDVHSDHQGRVVSDSSAAALPTDVNRHVLTNDDVRADFEAPWLRIRRDRLRGAAEDRKRVDLGAVPERRVALDDDVTVEPNPRAESSAWADHAPRSDDAIRREERALRDD